jgi:hypothetical protein
VDENEVVKSNATNEITIGYNSKSDKEKTPRITNGHKEGAGLLTKR